MEVIQTQFAACGQSLIPMYQYLQPILAKEGVQYLPDFAKKVSEITFKSDPFYMEDIDKEIVSLGLSGKDQVAKKVLELFVELLGYISGNLGLHTLPYSGLYIVGSLAKSLIFAL